MKINTKTKNHFGEWLKKYMNSREIDVSKLSKTLGIGRRYITHWLQGTSHPRLINAVFLIEALSKITKEHTSSIYEDMRSHIAKDF